MNPRRKEQLRTLGVAFAVSAVCSVAVSLTAVSLRDRQVANVESAKQRQILAAAGRLPADGDIAAAFASSQTRIVLLDSGEFVAAIAEGEPAPTPAEGERALTPAEDLAQIRRRENSQEIYLFYSDAAQRQLDTVVLPVRGYGLWSTLYGYLALESDLRSIRGLEFYEHKETAGLGGEVDNPAWKALWRGKAIYDREGRIAVEVVKGKVAADSSRAGWQVDGLAGATLTSVGVTKLLQFWLGELGYGPLLENLLENLRKIEGETGS